MSKFVVDVTINLNKCHDGYENIISHQITTSVIVLVIMVYSLSYLIEIYRYIAGF